jgi:excisionase family DNA binding protein
MQLLLSTSSVAEWLGLSARTVCTLAECGEIPAFKLGRFWRFREADVEDWVRRRFSATNVGVPPQPSQSSLFAQRALKRAK